MTTAREKDDVGREDLFEAEIHVTADTGEPGTKRRGRIIYVQLLAFLFGATLLVLLIRAVGVEPIFQALGQIHYGFLILLGLAGLRHALRTLSMRAAVAREHRRFSFWQAYTTRLAGETISFFTFTGPVLGEATKAALLRKSVPLPAAVQALAVDNLLYNLSVAVFISSGALRHALHLRPAPRRALAADRHRRGDGSRHHAHRRGRPLRRDAGDGGGRFLHPPRLEGEAGSSPSANHFQQVEENVYDFYKKRPRTFFTMLACDFGAHATTVAEVAAVLWMLGFEPGVGVSYIIDSLTKVINLVFSFVPATIGVYEGGTGLILNTLGYAVATGLTIGIVRKASMIVWALVGLLMLVRHTAPAALRKAIERHPRLREVMDNLVLSNMTHRPARTFVSILGVAVGVLLVAFTVGLAHGVLRERGRRESEVGAEIMMRAAGSTGFGAQRFAMPVSRAAEVSRIPGVRGACPAGQTTDTSDSGFGMRVIDGIDFDCYSRLVGSARRRGEAARARRRGHRGLGLEGAAEGEDRRRGQALRPRLQAGRRLRAAGRGAHQDSALDDAGERGRRGRRLLPRPSSSRSTTRPSRRPWPSASTTPSPKIRSSSRATCPSFTLRACPP